MYVSIERDNETDAIYYIYQQQKRRQLAIFSTISLIVTDLLLSVILPLLFMYAVRRHSSGAVATIIVVWVVLFTFLAVFFTISNCTSSSGKVGATVLSVLFLFAGILCFALGILPPHPSWVDVMVIALFFIVTQWVTALSCKQLYHHYIQESRGWRRLRRDGACSGGT